MPTEKKKEEKKEEKKDDKMADDSKPEEKKDEKKEEKVEEKKEDTEMVDAPTEFETKIRTKTMETKLKWTLVSNPTFSEPKRLEQCVLFEKKLIDEETAHALKMHLKNDCEAKSYEYKRRVDEDLAD